MIDQRDLPAPDSSLRSHVEVDESYFEPQRAILGDVSLDSVMLSGH
ncbi:hypothetical protein M0534_11625 [Methylonatrum kenyense]|nr:hypothetical protein [Methylonatrum kenyense]MCK8516969.1 hypothetical protein [Methylonatrum kenyense]